MNFDIPTVKCCISIESFATNGSVANRRSLTDAQLKLCRNQEGSCVLSLENKNGKEVKRFTFAKNEENYRLNTKFVHEGKASLSLPDLNLRLFFSNCPPDKLSLFLKGFSLKCNYHSKKNPSQNESAFGMFTRQVCDVRMSQAEAIEEISPLTSKDLIRNLALRNQNASPLILEAISESSPNTRRKLIRAVIPSPVRSLKVLNSNNLTDEQYSVLRSVMHGESLFFTGSAGTGKSYLLKFIISRLPPETTFVTASTGIAASHLPGGITLHMFAGIPVSWLEEGCFGQENRKLTPKEIAARLMKFEAKVQRWKQCKCLIIDEISMLHGEYFAVVDQVARIIRNCDKPFGGIQLVVCGDFLQLPPITKRDGKPESLKTKYAFQTKAWTEAIRQYFELRIIKRQTDGTFIKVLQLLRLGRVTESVKSILIKTSQNNLRKNSIIPTQLYTHRRDVDLVNRQQLQKLQSPSVCFIAQDSDPAHSAMLDSLCPTQRKIELKVGAQIMLNRNIDLNRGLVNGLVGEIIKFEDEGDAAHAVPRRYPVIRFVNGVQTTISPERWTVKLGGAADSKAISRVHLPLQLAWAMSVHKSQGMTISNGLEISLAKVFESGQAYVALSRATSLANVKIIDFNPKNIMVDSEALDFYKQLKYVS
ncbi:DNA helicase [Tyrophagus putrescentiae]|nr:DNA helicase [Tyrophagus putrescentiae]